MVTIGDDLLRPASPAFGPRSRRWSSTTATRWRSRRSRARWSRGFAREDLFTVVLEQFQHRHRRLRRLPAAGHHAAGALGHPHQLRPHRRDAEPAGHRAARARRAATPRVFRELARAHGLRRALLRRRRRGAVPHAPSADARRFRRAAGAGLRHAARCPMRRLPKAASPRLRAAANSSASAWRAQGQDGLPDHVPNHEPAGSSPRYPLAMISPPARNFLNSSFVNVQQPARHRGRAAAGDPCRRRGGARHRRRRRWCACSTTAASTAAAPRSRARARPGRGARPGHLVAQARAGRHQRQRAHQPAADRHRARARSSTTAWSRCEPRGEEPVCSWARSVAARLRWRPRCACSRLRRPGLLLAIGQRPPGHDARRPAGGRVARRSGRRSERLQGQAGADAAHPRLRGAPSSACPTTPATSRYADLHRNAAMWNVVAAPPYSLTLKTWCFPVTGCVGYRGYYDEAAAKAEAGEPRSAGLRDRRLPGAGVLDPGWMNWAGGDPLLTTFIGYPEGELARLVFHELAHQVLYVPDDTHVQRVLRDRGGAHRRRALAAHARQRGGAADYAQFDGAAPAVPRAHGRRRGARWRRSTARPRPRRRTGRRSTP